MRSLLTLLDAERDPGRAVALLAGVLGTAMDAIITVDEQQRIVLYNRAAERIFGWPLEQVLGQPLDRLIPERLRARHGEHIRRFAETGVTSRRMGDGTVVYGRRANGEEFPMDASISQLETAQGRLFTAILRDVTERVRANEERSAFTAAAHAIREEEKARVARELHDELAQTLTALKMDAVWLRDNMTAAQQAVSAKLAGMLEMLDGAVSSTRRIAADLRPLILDDLGLVPAIEWLASSFTERWGLHCELSLDPALELQDLQEPYATSVFRIVQESLANVAKHAQASQASVAIGLEAGWLVLSVSDDGRGFSPSAPRKANSLGLMGLRERVHLLGGSAEIASVPGQGTLVQVRIPLPGAQGRP